MLNPGKNSVEIHVRTEECSLEHFTKITRKILKKQMIEVLEEFMVDLGILGVLHRPHLCVLELLVEQIASGGITT